MYDELNDDLGNRYKDWWSVACLSLLLSPINLSSSWLGGSSVKSILSGNYVTLQNKMVGDLGSTSTHCVKRWKVMCRSTTAMGNTWSGSIGWWACRFYTQTLVLRQWVAQGLYCIVQQPPTECARRGNEDGLRIGGGMGWLFHSELNHSVSLLWQKWPRTLPDE